jgi:ankyrin repeat protein
MGWGFVDMARCLVKELGANVEDRFEGYSPLHAAVQMGHVAMMLCLVRELGANVNQATQGGSHYLHIAAHHARLDVMRCLVKELGVDVDRPLQNGDSSLCLAASNGNLAVLRCLKELGADINQPNQIGQTPVFLAANYGNLAALKCLVKEFGADINRPGPEGCTPLMVASYKKHAEMVKWMIKEGADTQANAESKTSGSRYAFTAADISTFAGASAQQTAYLEAKTHCSNPACSGAGIKRCPACKQARYCGEPCQYAHWKAHKADCKQWSAELKACVGANINSWGGTLSM